MDTEQLKLVIDMLAGIGEASKEGFIFWIIADKILPIVAWTSFGIFFIYAVYKLISKVTFEADLLELRSILYPSLRYGLNSSEVVMIKNRVKELASK